MKKILSGLCAAMAFTLSVPAQAQFAKPEDAVKYRKAGFTVMAAHFGRKRCSAGVIACIDIAHGNRHITHKVIKP